MAESVQQIARRLNREFKNDSLAIMADLQPKYERAAMGAMGFDFPLFGGLPEGRITQFSGKEASGKTTAACAAMAAYQRKYPEKTCVFIDVERALDKEFVSQVTGLDLTKLILVIPQTETGEQILDIAREFLNADDIGMVILDSVAALITSIDAESDVEEDKGMRSSIAKSMQKFLKQTIGVIAAKKSILLLINQVRVVGKTRMGAEILNEPGGSGLSFFSSVILRFGRRTFTNGDVVDGYKGEKADGIRLWFSIQKQKTASMQRGGGFITLRYDTGLDWMHDLMEVALKYEFIQRPTTQSYLIVNLETGEPYYDEKGEQLRIVGKQKVIDYFNANPAFQKEYLEMLINHISADSNKYGRLLDERLLKEIEADSIGDNYEETDKEPTD